MWGTSSKKQTVAVTGLSPDHGVVRIVNQGTLRDARTAISTIKVDAAGNFDWAFTGGIIQCDGAKFINNQRAIQYLSYHNKLSNAGSQIINNIGFIQRSLFETNDLLKDPAVSYPTAFITLFDVDGIRLRGNTFQNQSAVLPPFDKRGIGVGTVNASYYIDRFLSCSCPFQISGCPSACITANMPTTFKNLQYGVHSTGVAPINAVRINDNDFINCNRGIYLEAIDYAVLTQNRMDVGDGLNTFSGDFLPYAIYMDHCHGYKIEENVITTTVPSNTISQGVLFNGSAGLGNVLYRNSIDNMGVGTTVYGNNRGANPGEGLLIKCNAYGQQAGPNTYDIAMQWGGPPAYPFGEIDRFQGTAASGANNKFSHNCFSANDYLDQFNDPALKPVLYFFNQDVPTTTNPLCFSAPLQPNQITGTPYNPVTMCLSLFGINREPTNRVLALIQKNNALIKQKTDSLDLPVAKDRNAGAAARAARAMLEGQIADLNYEKAFALNHQIRELLGDTTDARARDSVLMLLQADAQMEPLARWMAASGNPGEHARAGRSQAKSTGEKVGLEYVSLPGGRNEKFRTNQPAGEPGSLAVP